MGICLDVESIVHTPRYPSLAPHTIYEAQWYAERWGLLALICKTFSWKKIPWDEPSTYHSAESYCCNKSKYDLLRTVACAAALKQPFTTPHSAWVAYHAAPPALPYRHLIERNDSEYMALYLPLDFVSPIAIPSTSAWDTFTVGSAVHLKQAADALAEISHQYGRERGASTVVDPRDDPVPHTWSGLQEFCQILSTYAQEGIEHNVPLFISW